MSDEKKIIKNEKEINFDELEKVTGGSLKDAKKKEPSPITDDMRNKI